MRFAQGRQDLVNRVVDFALELARSVLSDGVGELPGSRDLDAGTDVELVHRQPGFPLVETVHLRTPRLLAL